MGNSENLSTRFGHVMEQIKKEVRLSKERTGALVSFLAQRVGEEPVEDNKGPERKKADGFFEEAIAYGEDLRDDLSRNNALLQRLIETIGAHDEKKEDCQPAASEY